MQSAERIPSFFSPAAVLDWTRAEEVILVNFPMMRCQVKEHGVALYDAAVRERIVCLRGQAVILDADVAELYGVETKRVNEAVRNNPDKFPQDYMFVLTAAERADLRTKISSTKLSSKSRSLPKSFTEKGLYMLATILKSRRATEATFAIIETFARVRGIRRELVELHKETDATRQASKMQHFGRALTDIVMPDLGVVETESTLELNFFIGKIKHTVKRVKRAEDRKRRKR